MKIKRFNEGLEYIDIEYIDDCFVSLADDYPNYKSNLNNNTLSISIDIIDEYTIPNFNSTSTENMVKILEWKISLINEIRYCLDKVKIKYDNLSYSIYFNEHENMDEDTGQVNIVLQKNEKWYPKI
jgi:hypothetical protein